MYEPAEDSFLLRKVAKEEANKRHGCNTLDMGSGTGFVAGELAKTCKITSVDIDDEAIEHLKKNLPKNARIIKSDLFSNIHKDEKFDIITFNPPYLPLDDDEEPAEELHGGKTGVELTIKFLRQAKQHLSENGIILFVASSTSQLDVLIKDAENLGFKLKIREQVHIFFEDIIVYEAKL